MLISPLRGQCSWRIAQRAARRRATALTRTTRWRLVTRAFTVTRRLAVAADPLAPARPQIPLQIRILDAGMEDAREDPGKGLGDLLQVADHQAALVKLPGFQPLMDDPAHDLVDTVRSGPGQRAHRRLHGVGQHDDRGLPRLGLGALLRIGTR